MVSYSIHAPRNWMKPNHIGEGRFLHSCYRFKCYSHPETPSQKHPLLRSHQFNHRETINKGHPNEGSCWGLKDSRIVGFGGGGDIGLRNLRQEALLLHKMEMIHSVWVSCKFNEMKNVEASVLERAYSRSSINEWVISFFSLLEDKLRILCKPVDYTAHGILLARILEWVAYPFSRGSSQPRNQTAVSCIAGRFFINWAIKEAPLHSSGLLYILVTGRKEGGLSIYMRPWMNQNSPKLP